MLLGQAPCIQISYHDGHDPQRTGGMSYGNFLRKLFDNPSQSDDSTDHR